MTNTASIYMPIAKKHGVTCRIAHSHNTHGKAGLLGAVTDILQRPIYKNATDWFACSKAAAYWFYPKEEVDAGKVTVLANAVEAVIKLVILYNPDAIMVIKSTIPVGFTASVREKYHCDNILFSPDSTEGIGLSLKKLQKSGLKVGNYTNFLLANAN